jgi:hypothetical protein
MVVPLNDAEITFLTKTFANAHLATPSDSHLLHISIDPSGKVISIIVCSLRGNINHYKTHPCRVFHYYLFIGVDPF